LSRIAEPKNYLNYRGAAAERRDCDLAHRDAPRMRRRYGRSAGASRREASSGGAYIVLLGINRAAVRSYAISWNIWFRLLVGRAFEMQVPELFVAV